MDADEIADEQERRVQQLRQDRQYYSQRGLGGIVRGGPALPEPELAPAIDAGYSTTQLTAKDIAGAAPDSEESGHGLSGWLNRRQKEKEEQQMRKMEKWHEIMAKKQKEKAAKQQ